MEIRREWNVEVAHKDVGGPAWPAVKVPAGKEVFQPDRIIVRVWQVNDEPLRVTAIVASGMQILKSGQPGEARHSRHYWESHGNLPEWVSAAKTAAVLKVAEEVIDRA